MMVSTMGVARATRRLEAASNALKGRARPPPRLAAVVRHLEVVPVAAYLLQRHTDLRDVFLRQTLFPAHPNARRARGGPAGTAPQCCCRGGRLRASTATRLWPEAAGAVCPRMLANKAVQEQQRTACNMATCYTQWRRRSPSRHRCCPCSTRAHTRLAATPGRTCCKSVRKDEQDE